MNSLTSVLFSISPINPFQNDSVSNSRILLVKLKTVSNWFKQEVANFLEYSNSLSSSNIGSGIIGGMAILSISLNKHSFNITLGTTEVVLFGKKEVFSIDYDANTIKIFINNFYIIHFFYKNKKSLFTKPII